MSIFSPLNADKMRGDTDKTSESRSSTRDLQMAGYVAVKVIIADGSLNAPEASLLCSLGNSPSRLGRETISPLIEQFWATGPNGKHKCIATLPARMSLFDAKGASSFGLYRPKVAQSIIAQLIRGVAFLHSEDIVHGEPEPEAVIRVDGNPFSKGAPANVYVPGWFGDRSDDMALGREEIILSDFGESFNPHKTLRFSSKTLPLLQPPESRLPDEPLTFASDI
ncbi:hypothetical protein BDV26DRAFT_300446 [Aspergillus bertholletiae]|uniref:Protein kinase domain-containing protein n=1 Tax=Aspergillus bertholletiae TaxID=1226010 RepID=A0A5N7BJJ8_9EURO|nr:hypothetical protein BDV26DRAFT_300446 [Aspergillus bertholletiae]